ncbi:MAG: hypothetical protein IT366_25190 [Candidatus Hydrogenedentes bacterium]|nr:hypothetical protein [Candidatus Hydrogenedentota bacterium]
MPDHVPRVSRALVSLWCVFAACNAAGADASNAEAPERLQLIDITWSAGKHMPQGMQDNVVNELGGWLISVGGFCGGVDDDWKPGKYPRGFLNKVWGLEIAREADGWQTLPDYPGAPRQALFGAVVDNALYVWGGFSYDAPYTYADGYRISRVNQQWAWTRLPDLPSPSAWSGICAVGSRLYSFGGADYDAQRFYTDTDRSGTVARLGARLIVFDTAQPDKGWLVESECPGTPRCLSAAAVVGDAIYFIGGLGVASSGEYCNVVDNWKYAPVSRKWERIRDLPMSGSGSTSNRIVYQSRYVLLPCGYQYDRIKRPDGSLADRYGTPSKVVRTWKSHPKLENTAYFNHCYVYDTETDSFGTATPLPFDDVASITVVLGDTVYMFPGETGGFVWEGEYFGHHPEFVLKGALRLH